LIGRSNVGKSSIINALAQKKIAITAKTPGRTQCVNFYQFNKFRLVDLPGYGYAKASKDTKKNLSYIIDKYLQKRHNLFAIFLVIDKNISPLDLNYLAFLKKRFVNFFLLVNKIDQYNQKTMNSIKKQLQTFKVNEQQIVYISAKNYQQIDCIWKIIKQLLQKIN
jgi:GTP-binding protein